MASAPPDFCVWCGRPSTDCDGSCRKELDPPRYCPVCGKKLIAQVTPTGYWARCKAHGSFDLASLGDDT